jgi:hypothetical protein
MIRCRRPSVRTPPHRATSNQTFSIFLHLARSIPHRDLFPISQFLPTQHGRGRLPLAASSLCTSPPCRTMPPPHHPLAVRIYSALHASPSPYADRVGLQRATPFPLAICRPRQSAVLCLPPPRHTLAMRSLARFAPHPRRTSVVPVSSALPALPLASGLPARRRPISQWSTMPLHSTMAR